MNTVSLNSEQRGAQFRNGLSAGDPLPCSRKCPGTCRLLFKVMSTLKITYTHLLSIILSNYQSVQYLCCRKQSKFDSWELEPWMLFSSSQKKESFMCFKKKVSQVVLDFANPLLSFICLNLVVWKRHGREGIKLSFRPIQLSLNGGSEQRPVQISLMQQAAHDLLPPHEWFFTCVSAMFS